MNRKIILLQSLNFLFFVCFSVLNFAQDNNIQSYQFISPIPGSSMILPGTNIIIREGSIINKSSMNKNNLIIVTGSQSGNHYGELTLSDDDKTILFKPFNQFNYGETVTVAFSRGIYTVEGNQLLPFDFQFNISGGDAGDDYNPAIKEILDFNNISGRKSNKSSSQTKKLLNDGLPDDFPPITINVSTNPAPGYTFIAPFTWPLPPLGYLIIVDNSGIPVYFKRTTSLKADFKLQGNGLLTYYDLPVRSFFAMDSSYNIVDTFKTGNGYLTDLHEFQLLPNGHALLMANDNQVVRMDTIVAGGDSTAVVAGLIIQEIDTDKNVVFQWRSWDHFLITDATEDINLTASFIDYVHGNALELDDDGNILLSSRHMDEITKIDRQTGDIIWRLGGIKSRNNEFTFINDSRTFSHQHDIRRLANGNITLFNNGNLLLPQYSSGLEYQLDEVNKTATLVWSYNNSPSTFSFAMGSVQRLDNESNLIGWGWATDDMRAVTEVKSNGNLAFELSMPDSFINYRAFRFPWKTNLFTANPDSIFFESVPPGDSATITISLQSNSPDSIKITSFYNKNSFYSVENTVPFVINPFSSVPVTIKFKPGEEGYSKDFLHINSDTDSSRIAQVVILAGRTDSTISSVEDGVPVSEFNLEQNYPNPFNPSTTIRYEIPGQARNDNMRITLKVYDVLGREVATLVNEEQPAGFHKVKFDAATLASGMYIYRLTAGRFSSVKKMLLVK